MTYRQLAVLLTIIYISLTNTSFAKVDPQLFQNPKTRAPLIYELFYEKDFKQSFWDRLEVLKYAHQKIIPMDNMLFGALLSFTQDAYYSKVLDSLQLTNERAQALFLWTDYLNHNQNQVNDYKKSTIANATSDSLRKDAFLNNSFLDIDELKKKFAFILARDLDEDKILVIFNELNPNTMRMDTSLSTESSWVQNLNIKPKNIYTLSTLFLEKTNFTTDSELLSLLADLKLKPSDLVILPALQRMKALNTLYNSIIVANSATASYRSQIQPLLPSEFESAYQEWKAKSYRHNLESHLLDLDFQLKGYRMGVRNLEFALDTKLVKEGGLLDYLKSIMTLITNTYAETVTPPKQILYGLAYFTNELPKNISAGFYNAFWKHRLLWRDGIIDNILGDLKRCPPNIHLPINRKDTSTSDL